MINHGRTLLLNRDGAARPAASFYLEEFVDPSYQALVLPSHLRELHLALFGDRSDHAFANFRVQQYTRMLHATEFGSYLFDLDPRVTYLRRDMQALRKTSTQGVPFNALAGTKAIDIIGTLEQSLRSPTLFHNWNVTATGALLVATRHIQTGASNSNVVTLTSGRTDPIPLAGQKDLFVSIQSAAPLNVGAQWRVEMFAEPTHDLTDLLQTLEGISPLILTELFPRREPYTTFKELWTKHVLLPYRLSGILLAFIYQAEEIRTHAS